MYYNEDQKAKPTDVINQIVVGGKDSSGNKITDVLAKGNEYAVYEIDVKDVQKRLRVKIDGINDERERQVVEWYTKVKDKYLEAKGLLYRSDEYNMFRNRVAHTLATALCGYEDLALSQFNKLIYSIKEEYRDKYIKRIFYIFPGYAILTMLIVFVSAIHFNIIYNNKDLVFWVGIVASAVIGGVLSLTVNLPKIRFETEVYNSIYFVFGLERISISILSGLVCTFAIKSKIILGGVFDPDDIELYCNNSCNYNYFYNGIFS
jgi:hypothetical protein